jgi:hypothetical protein
MIKKDEGAGCSPRHTPGHLSWTTPARRKTRWSSIGQMHAGHDHLMSPHSGMGANLYMYVHVLSRRRAMRRQKGGHAEWAG